MARLSKVERMPSEVRETIGKLRRNGCTIDAILEKLAELDVKIPRSTLGRHIKELDKIAEDIRWSAGIGEAIGEKFGDAPDDKARRVVSSQLTSLAMRMLHASQIGGKIEANEARAWADVLDKLSRSEKVDTDRMLKIEHRAEDRARKAAAATATASMKRQGLSADMIKQIEHDILGVAT